VIAPSPQQPDLAPLALSTAFPSASPVDHQLCRDALPRVSRTFALSIEALPDELRDAVRAAYLLCRVVDTIEDGDGLGVHQRLRLFDEFERVLGSDQADPSRLEQDCRELMLGVDAAERSLCLRAGAVFRVFRGLPLAQRQAIRPWVEEMAHGMREHVLRAGPDGRLRIGSLPELERYCYFVAGTVGRLLTELFCQALGPASSAGRSTLDELGVSFGIGLQLVNVVKDVAEDWERGACFVPRQLVAEAGIAFEQLLEPRHREQALQVVDALCDRARHHLERAKRYTELWPLPEGAPMRLFCTVPLALALATLRELDGSDRTLRIGTGPKLSREAVLRILEDAGRAVYSNRALEALWTSCS
jgi:farnesyl-diphosphate farnesyltransferase